MYDLDYWPHDYWPYDRYPDIVCPTCQGNGYISIDTEKFGPVKIACPNCHGCGLECRNEMKGA